MTRKHKTRDQLDQALDAVENTLSELIRDHPKADDFLSAFRSATDMIENAASVLDIAYVRARIDRILKAALGVYGRGKNGSGK